MYQNDIENKTPKKLGRLSYVTILTKEKQKHHPHVSRPKETRIFCQVSLLCHEDLKSTYALEKMDYEASNRSICHQFCIAGQNFMALPEI